MNVTVYLFGEFNNGYAQYPDDYTVGKFNNFYTNSKSNTQIAIHREGNLMYYGYVRKLEQRRYIGFCVVINGLMLTKLDGLFSLYENTISNLVTNGQLIHFNEQGNIVSNVDRLYMNREEIDFLSELFRNGFHRLKDSVQSLPAVSYGVSKDSVKNFSIEDNIEEIIKSSHTYGYTYIYKSKDFNTSQLNSYKSVLSRLNNEKSKLTKRYDDLVKEHEKTLKQKKQYRFVAFLCLLVLGCGIGLLSLNDNLNNTKFALQEANKTIIEQNNSLVSKNEQITNLEDKNHQLVKRYNAEHSLKMKIEDSLTSLKNIIIERQPFILKNTSFNFNTGYLSFDYYGFKNELVKIEVRVYSDDGYSYSNSSYIEVSQGENSDKVFLSRDLNTKKWYSFEILNEKIILGGDRH
jgi:hypothetical protein